MNRGSAKRKHRRAVVSRTKSLNSPRSVAIRKTIQKPLLQEYSTQLLYGCFNQSSSSFTGLDKNRIIDAPYASTSHYLRQLLHNETGKQVASSGKQRHSSPLYKTQEEYYDEVIALKKQIQDLSNENSVLKLKAQRTEEEYLIKKQQDVQQHYMDSTKVEHTLRQKLANVERVLREKDLAYSQLQSDLKATKLEEMKSTLEVYLAEIQRLKKKKHNRVIHTPRNGTKNPVDELSSRTQELVKSLQKMGREKSRLLQENKLLKEDLQKCMENQRRSAHDRKYEDMTKGELLSTVTKLEHKVEKLESGDFDKLSARRSSKPDVDGKLTLEGSLVQRLDQLDKRESELLEELSKKKSVIVQLREDRSFYQDKCAKNEKELKQLRKEIAELQEELGSSRDDRSHLAKSLASGRRSPSVASVRSSVSKHDLSSHSSHHPVRVENFRRSRAAKVIQRGWRQHGNRSRGINEEVELIQSALKGQSIRRKNLSRLRGFMAEEDEEDVDDSEARYEESDDAIQRIQSTMKGHRFRRRQLTNSSLASRRLSNSSSVQSLPRPPSSLGFFRSLSGQSLNASQSDSPRNNRFLVSGRKTPSSTGNQNWSHGSGRYSPAQALSTVTDDSDDGISLNSSRQRPIFR